MYAYVTEALDAALPGQHVLLDDFAGNVNGARAVGWQAILVGSDHAAATPSSRAPRLTRPV